MNAKKSELSSKRERTPEDRKRLQGGNRRLDRNDQFQRTITPLNKQPIDLLEVVMKKPGV